MAHLRFHVRFPEDKVKEPIIYQIGREYNMVTNVRRADVRETTGWVDVELSGETAEDRERDPGTPSQRLRRRSDRIERGRITHAWRAPL